MQFTDDPLVKDSLSFLMTREIAHFQVFSAALDDVKPNFPPGVLQGDPRHTHTYFNMSDGSSARGPWNQGQGSWGAGEHWVDVEDPVREVVETHGQIRNHPVEGTFHSYQEVKEKSKTFGHQRREEIKSRLPKGENQWSAYPQKDLPVLCKLKNKLGLRTAAGTPQTS